jgi:hypothetical protein
VGNTINGKEGGKELAKRRLEERKKKRKRRRRRNNKTGKQMTGVVAGDIV